MPSAGTRSAILRQVPELGDQSAYAPVDSIEDPLEYVFRMAVRILNHTGIHRKGIEMAQDQHPVVTAADQVENVAALSYHDQVGPPQFIALEQA